ncbi:MAG: hypothetical protein KBF89_02485 [Acidimicrobiia bacterium]|nr:hypothetical protein [Acidimicrobiia bacterium]
MVHPTISDWNRFEEWIYGLNGLAQFVKNEEEEGYKPYNPQILTSSMTTATDWNQK